MIMYSFIDEEIKLTCGHSHLEKGKNKSGPAGVYVGSECINHTFFQFLLNHAAFARRYCFTVHREIFLL